MSANDKFGLGAGALALGLAGLMIFIGQLTPPDFFFHRDWVQAEAIADFIVFLVGVPTGIYLFYQGARTKDEK